jgi:hypothetical protein
MDSKKRSLGGAKKKKRPPPKPVQIGPDGNPVRPRLMRDILPQIYSHPGWPALPQERRMAVDMVGNRGHLYHLVYSVWDFLYLGTPILD